MTPSWHDGLERLQERLGYHFDDQELLQMALTHRSWTHERGDANYERLEFLGDAILNAAVTALLYDRFATIDEGALSQQKHNLVCGTTLAKIGVQLDLSPLMRVGLGARKNNVQNNQAKIEDTTEALIGAVYLDAGYERAAAIVRDLMEAHLLELQVVTEEERSAYKNAVQRLHELTQRHPLRTRPAFQVLDTHGSAHAPSFHIAVVLFDEVIASAWGTSKQDGKRQASALALTAVQQRLDDGWRGPSKALKSAREDEE